MSFSDRGIDVTGPTLRGSPLYIAGIDRGDRIVEADGKSLKTRQNLDDLAASHKPGDRSTLTVETRTGRKQVQITWAQAPDVEIVSFEKAGRQGDAGDHGVPRCVAGIEGAAAVAEDRLDTIRGNETP